MKGKKIALGLACTALLEMAAGAAGQNEDIQALLNREISIQYNGAETALRNANGDTVYPITYEGTTYLPLRAVAEMLGADVDWDAETNSVYIQDGGSAAVAFSVSLRLPDGWSIRSVAKDEQTQVQQLYCYLAGHDKQFLFDETGACVGAIAYNAYTVNAGEMESRQTVYPEVGIANDYRFDIYGKYEVVNSTDYGETALTDVYSSAAFLSTWYEDAAEQRNSGVLSYDSRVGAYVMLELDAGAVSADTVQSIAESLAIAQ
ncbi:MAG: copper amine oxidase N-terminal domain-containing protein [Oscillospiraceae bacterium]|nr:copper amine oxidase N-terminal domain-containing protein [Oscillospiraceae bacterium]